MKMRNLLILGVGTLALGAFGCGAQGDVGTENIGSSSGAAWAQSSPASLTGVIDPGVCVISTSKFVLFGGYTNIGRTTVTDKVQLVDASAAAITVTQLTALTEAVGEPQVIWTGSRCLVSGGRKVVMGAQDSVDRYYLYDPSSTGTLNGGTLASNAGRFGAAFVQEASGKYMLTGGFTGASVTAAVNTVEEYDLTGATPSINSSFTTMNSARAYHTANNFVGSSTTGMVTGGLTGTASTTILNTTEKFNGGTFTNSATMQTGRARHQALPISNGTKQLMVAGGVADNAGAFSVLSSVEYYDSAGGGGLGVWATTATAMANARVDFIVVPNGTANQGYAIGGSSGWTSLQGGGETSLKTVALLDGSLATPNVGAAPASLNSERLGHGGAYLSGANGGAAVVVATGYRTQAPGFLTSVEKGP